MKNKLKSGIAICVVIFNLLACISTNAADITTEWNSEQKNTSELIVTTGSGSCGDNMTWELDESGTLTISGSGKMYNYVDYVNNSVTIPWLENNNAAAIKKVVVENGVESISDMAFYGTSIESLKLPDSVKSIGKDSIANCQNLTAAVLSDNITDIPEGAFNCDGNLEVVTLPATLMSISESAFIHCYKLKDIAIPASVTDIKDMAFFDCPLISEVVIPDKVTSIKRGAFESCDALKSVIFPQNLTKVEQSAFSNCANIEEVILPDGLTEIGKNAFSYSKKDRNSNLPKQKVYVPRSVKTIDKNGIDSDSVIYGFKNSTAETYAKENNIEFVEVSESMYDANSYKEAYYSQFQSNFEKLLVKNGDKLSISLDNKELNFEDAEPFIDKNGRTQVPIYALSEPLGLKLDWEVVWNGPSTAVLTSASGDIVKITIGGNVMTANNKEITMDTEAVIIDDRTYIPVRFVAEALGLTVEWVE